MLDKVFRKVKWIPPTSSSWFSTNDHLEGIETVGEEANDAAEWSIYFKNLNFTKMLFATGDF